MVQTQQHGKGGPGKIIWIQIFLREEKFYPLPADANMFIETWEQGKVSLVAQSKIIRRYTSNKATPCSSLELMRWVKSQLYFRHQKLTLSQQFYSLLEEDVVLVTSLPRVHTSHFLQARHGEPLVPVISSHHRDDHHLELQLRVGSVHHSHEVHLSLLRGHSGLDVVVDDSVQQLPSLGAHSQLISLIFVTHQVSLLPVQRDPRDEAGPLDPEEHLAAVGGVEEAAEERGENNSVQEADGWVEFELQ